MKINIKKDGFHMIHLVLGIALALTPFVSFPVCTKLMKNGKPMPCYYSGQLIVAIGIGIAIFALLGWLLKKKWVSTIVYVISLLAAALAYMIPKRIIEVGHMEIDGWQCGLCKSPDMSCNVQTMPAVTVLVLLLILSCVLALMINFLRKEE